MGERLRTRMASVVGCFRQEAGGFVEMNLAVDTPEAVLMEEAWMEESCSEAVRAEEEELGSQLTALGAIASPDYAKIKQEKVAKLTAQTAQVLLCESGADDAPSYLTKALAAATTADAPQYLMAAQRVAEKSQVVAAEKPEAVKEDVAVTGAVKLLKRCAQCDKEESIGGVPLVRCTACYKEGVSVTYCNAQCQKAHWKGGHKQTCKHKPKKAAVASPQPVVAESQAPSQESLRKVEAAKQATRAAMQAEREEGREAATKLEENCKAVKQKAKLEAEMKKQAQMKKAQAAREAQQQQQRLQQEMKRQAARAQQQQMAAARAQQQQQMAAARAAAARQQVNDNCLDNEETPPWMWATIAVT